MAVHRILTPETKFEGILKATGTNSHADSVMPRSGIESAITAATLTTEQVQDVIGAMLGGNTETGISATYQDGDGTIDLVTEVTLAGSETLTNKTLTTPTINAAALSGNLSGTPNFTGIATHAALEVFNAGGSFKNGSSTAGFIELFEDSDNGSKKITLIGQADVGAADLVVTLPGATDTLVGKATTDTLTNKTLTSPVLNTAVSGTAVLDEDNMATNSALHLATQQSIKAYVDAQTHAAALTTEQVQDISGGMLTGNTETGITVTYQDSDGTVDFVTEVTLAGSETLTNKTMTSVVLNTNVSGSAVLDEDNMATNSALHLATQQSIKAYVDTTATSRFEATNQNLAANTALTVTHNLGNQRVICQVYAGNNQLAVEVTLVNANSLTVTSVGNVNGVDILVIG